MDDDDDIQIIEELSTPKKILTVEEALTDKLINECYENYSASKLTYQIFYVKEWSSMIMDQGSVSTELFTATFFHEELISYLKTKHPELEKEISQTCEKLQQGLTSVAKMKDSIRNAVFHRWGFARNGYIYYVSTVLRNALIPAFAGISLILNNVADILPRKRVWEVNKDDKIITNKVFNNIFKDWPKEWLKDLRKKSNSEENMELFLECTSKLTMFLIQLIIELLRDGINHEHRNRGAPPPFSSLPMFGNGTIANKMIEARKNSRKRTAERNISVAKKDKKMNLPSTSENDAQQNNVTPIIVEEEENEIVQQPIVETNFEEELEFEKREGEQTDIRIVPVDDIPTSSKNVEPTLAPVKEIPSGPEKTKDPTINLAEDDDEIQVIKTVLRKEVVQTQNINDEWVVIPETILKKVKPEEMENEPEKTKEVEKEKDKTPTSNLEGVLQMEPRTVRLKNKAVARKTGNRRNLIENEGENNANISIVINENTNDENENMDISSEIYEENNRRIEINKKDLIEESKIWKNLDQMDAIEFVFLEKLELDERNEKFIETFCKSLLENCRKYQTLKLPENFMRRSFLQKEDIRNFVLDLIEKIFVLNLESKYVELCPQILAESILNVLLSEEEMESRRCVEIDGFKEAHQKLLQLFKNEKVKMKKSQLEDIVCQFIQFLTRLIFDALRYQFAFFYHEGKYETFGYQPEKFININSLWISTTTDIKSLMKVHKFNELYRESLSSWFFKKCLRDKDIWRMSSKHGFEIIPSLVFDEKLLKDLPSSTKSFLFSIISKTEKQMRSHIMSTNADSINIEFFGEHAMITKPKKCRELMAELVTKHFETAFGDSEFQIFDKNMRKYIEQVLLSSSATMYDVEGIKKVAKNWNPYGFAKLSSLFENNEKGRMMLFHVILQLIRFVTILTADIVRTILFVSFKDNKLVSMSYTRKSGVYQIQMSENEKNEKYEELLNGETKDEQLGEILNDFGKRLAPPTIISEDNEEEDGSMGKRMRMESTSWTNETAVVREGEGAKWSDWSEIPQVETISDRLNTMDRKRYEPGNERDEAILEVMKNDPKISLEWKHRMRALLVRNEAMREDIQEMFDK